MLPVRLPIAASTAPPALHVDRHRVRAHRQFGVVVITAVQHSLQLSMAGDESWLLGCVVAHGGWNVFCVIEMDWRRCEEKAGRLMSLRNVAYSTSFNIMRTSIGKLQPPTIVAR